MKKREAARTLRVTIQTPSALVLSGRATEIQLPARGGHRVALRPGAKPTLFAIAPGVITVREPDGQLVRVDASWGMLALADGEARVLVRDATLHLSGVAAASA